MINCSKWKWSILAPEPEEGFTIFNNWQNRCIPKGSIYKTKWKSKQSKTNNHVESICLFYSHECSLHSWMEILWIIICKSTSNSYFIKCKRYSVGWYYRTFNHTFSPLQSIYAVSNCLRCMNFTSLDKECHIKDVVSQNKISL